MSTIKYDLPVGSGTVRRTTSAWLMLGLASLVGAGLFSLLLVLARTPVVQAWMPIIDFFHVALIVHVDLSVLIWLLSIAGVLWALSTDRDWLAWDRVSFWMAASGTAVVVIAPFVGAGDPLMNNYVPVLRHPVFFIGLGLFMAGVLSHLLRSVLSFTGLGVQLDGFAALRVGTMLAAVTTAVAIGAFVASLAGIPDGVEGQAYFEFLFWGSGHVLQFTHTLLMMVVWVVLASSSGCRLNLTPRLMLVLFMLMALPVIAVPFIYFAHEIASSGHRQAFTLLMRYGGLASLPMGLAVVAAFWRATKPQGEGRYLRSALASSIALFATGGVLGFMIAGLDIVIPAHYHGSTVGVTLAFMGLSYYLLPRLGFGALPPRLAFWQPIIYCSGQILHIFGLVWSGGYGVQRKTVDLTQGFDQLSEVAAMGLMGFGGLVSVVGGLLFLVVAYRSISATGCASERQNS